MQLRPKLGASVALMITAGAVGPPAADAAPRADRVERAVVKRVNDVRAQHGLPSLRMDQRLKRAADAHSRDMVGRAFFSHNSSDGTPFRQRLRRYTTAPSTGETLAFVGARERGKARKVVRLWMNSPGHRAALLTRDFRRIGVAKRNGPFGGKRAAVFTADLSCAN